MPAGWRVPDINTLACTRSNTRLLRTLGSISRNANLPSWPGTMSRRMPTSWSRHRVRNSATSGNAEGRPCRTASSPAKATISTKSVYPRDPPRPFASPSSTRSRSSSVRARGPEGRAPRPRRGRARKRPRRIPRTHGLRRDGRLRRRRRGPARPPLDVARGRGLPHPVAGAGRRHPPARRPGPRRQVRIPADGPERPEQARLRPGARERTDVRHALSGGDVRRPPGDRARSSYDPDLQVPVPEDEPPPARPPGTHDVVREAELADARPDRATDRGNRRRGPGKRGAVLSVVRTTRRGPLAVPGAPRRKKDLGRATGVDEGAARRVDRGVAGRTSRRRRGLVRRPGRIAQRRHRLRGERR